MVACPHCAKDGVGVLAKWWSLAASPARCKNCGGLSYVAVSRGATIGRAAGVLIPVASVAVLVLAGWHWALLAIVAMLLSVLLAQAVLFYRTPLIPTSATEVGEARHWQLIGYVILGLVALGIGVWIWASRAL